MHYCYSIKILISTSNQIKNQVPWVLKELEHNYVGENFKGNLKKSIENESNLRRRGFPINRLMEKKVPPSNL